MLPGWGYDRGSPTTYGFGAALRAITGLFRKAKTRIAAAPPDATRLEHTPPETEIAATAPDTELAAVPPETVIAATPGTVTDLQVRTKPTP